MVSGKIIEMKNLFLLIGLVLFLMTFTSAQSNILKKDIYLTDDLKKFCIEYLKNKGQSDYAYGWDY